MNRYIILTNSISFVGGGQIYVRNKKVFLEDNDWKVDIFSSTQGKIYIDDLTCFSKNIILELRFPPYLFPVSTVNDIVNRISATNYIPEKTVIESNTITAALWGEIIASRTGAKHIVFLLGESFGALTNYAYDFLDFKHERKELAGISQYSLPLLFKGRKNISSGNNYYLKAVCTNVIADIACPLLHEIHIQSNNVHCIKIGCITRLGKSYVPNILSEIIDFALNNTGTNIQLVFIGGSSNNRDARNLLNMCSSIPNLNIFITGFIFPLPIKLITSMDLFIGTAGSARISSSQGVLTISVDARNGTPIGLLGYTTENALYSDNTDNTFGRICDFLQDYFINRSIVLPKKISSSLEMPDYRVEFVKHLDFISDSDRNSTYFSNNKRFLGFKDIIKIIILRTFGAGVLIRCLRLSSILRAVFNRFSA